jgi:hypothetical protein
MTGEGKQGEKRGIITRQNKFDELLVRLTVRNGLRQATLTGCPGLKDEQDENRYFITYYP